MGGGGSVLRGGEGYVGGLAGGGGFGDGEGCDGDDAHDGGHLEFAEGLIEGTE